MRAAADPRAVLGRPDPFGDRLPTSEFNTRKRAQKEARLPLGPSQAALDPLFTCFIVHLRANECKTTSSCAQRVTQRDLINGLQATHCTRTRKHHVSRRHNAPHVVSVRLDATCF